MPGAGTFLSEFLRRPDQVASLVPSSGFLKRRLVRTADVASATTVVELGPGNGGTTRALLEAMPPASRLLAVELNPRLHAVLARIADERLIAHHGSATDLEALLTANALPRPEVIVSGIPFSRLDRDQGRAIVTAIQRALAPGGRFVAYQLSARVAALTTPFMGRGQRQWEPRNVPPLRVYRWDQPTDGSDTARYVAR